MNSSNSSSQSNGAGFFLILTLFFLSISVWQTAQGYELLMGKYLAWFFSFAIGLMMLFLAFEMRKRKLRGQSAVGPLIGYCACAIFCFFGNFNAIYSRYNKEELYTKELQSHKEELTAIVASAKVYLKKVDPASEKLRKDVEEHEGQLIKQINDPADLGRGKEARAEIAIIEDLLKQKLTPFSGDPRTMAESYRKNIDDLLKTELSETKDVEAKDLIVKFDAKKDTLEPLIYEALKPQNVTAKGPGVIFLTVDAINAIGKETTGFLGSGTSFTYPHAEFENQEIGKISHSFQSAFNGNNNISAIISMLVALAIDALVPFVIFVGTRRQDDDENYTSGDGRKGGVAIIR